MGEACVEVEAEIGLVFVNIERRTNTEILLSTEYGSQKQSEVVLGACSRKKSRSSNGELSLTLLVFPCQNTQGS